VKTPIGTRTVWVAGLCAVLDFGCSAEASPELTDDLGSQRVHTAPTSYTVQALTGLPPGSAARALNDRGQIVVNTTDGSTSHAFLWEPGKVTDLGTLGGNDAYAWDINESGVIVGESQTAAGDQVPFVWQNGTMTALVELDREDPRAGAAYAVNEDGRVVGVLYGREVGEKDTGFAWEAGTFTELALPSDASWTGSTAWDINDAGEIVGEVHGADGSAPIRWADGGVTVLARSEQSQAAAALAINIWGAVVGRDTDEEHGCRAAAWQTAAPEYLTFQPGIAVAVNDEGMIVGQHATTADHRSAFVQGPGGALDLNTATVNNHYADTAAMDINRGGRIAGAGFAQGNAWRDAEAVVWTPVSDDGPLTTN
jgi:probable HAF family extracellular repeat protein